MIALLGVSGQGKSTLLRILASLTRADEGDIAMQGASQRQMDPREWRMKVCYVAQQPVMLGGSIEHNLKTVSLLHRTPYDKKLAERLMGELGLDLSQEFPKPLTDEVVRAADIVITMGCGDACPLYAGKKYEDWELEDPAGKPIETVRRIRDEIRTRVERLLSELNVPVTR